MQGPLSATGDGSAMVPHPITNIELLIYYRRFRDGSRHEMDPDLDV